MYRAVDKNGATVDFMFSVTRDRQAAAKFFSKAIGSNGLPTTVTIDKSGANNAALAGLNLQFLINNLGGLFITVKQVKYLNNIAEQDHRQIKRITRPMLGFKSFAAANATLAGIELHHMIKKGQMIDANNTPVWQQFLRCVPPNPAPPQRVQHTRCSKPASRRQAGTSARAHGQNGAFPPKLPSRFSGAD